MTTPGLADAPFDSPPDPVSEYCIDAFQRAVLLVDEGTDLTTSFGPGFHIAPVAADVFRCLVHNVVIGGEGADIAAAIQSKLFTHLLS